MHRNHPSGASAVARCRSLAHEAAMGLVSCRARKDESGVLTVMRGYAGDARAMKVSDLQAQSLLAQAITSIAVAGFQKLATAQNETLEGVLQRESLQVSTWANQHVG